MVENDYFAVDDGILDAKAFAVCRQREAIHTERCDGRTFPFTRQFNNKYLLRIGRAILDEQYGGWLNG
ncbi:hypothetical protein [Mesorhizobium sp. L103C565B0]|uniref:hypothetical protein n=1 Tax=Mesorhizobium sp. L103C565B0 TaxID=1287094 RepID=UPI001AEC0AD9|nr:hypothetical protein [Mesorhizobium sp. L103C565B0]